MIEGQEIFMAIPVPLLAFAAGSAARAVLSSVVKRAAGAGVKQALKKITSKPMRKAVSNWMSPHLAIEFGSDAKELTANQLLNLADKLWELLEKNGLLHKSQSTASNKNSRHQRNPRKSPQGTGNGTNKSKRPNR